MANEDYNAELYFKMKDSMDNYTEWLKNQPADEILNHTYEYTVKQDILMAFEEMDLSDAQAKALLNTKDPLGEIYEKFTDMETGYMQTLSGCITERGDEFAAAQAEDRKIAVISVEPGKEPVLKEIDSGLESLQHEVLLNSRTSTAYMTFILTTENKRYHLLMYMNMAHRFLHQ